jgi:anti-anti-sigma factor
MLTIQVKRAELVDPGFIADVQIKILEVIEATEKPRVLFDLSRVRMASSAAVGLTLAIHRAVDERQGRLAIVVGDDGVRAVFERCRVESLVNVHEKTESALRSLARQD